MHNVVYFSLCKFKLINPEPFGFRANQSTKHASISLIETIKLNFDSRLSVSGIFVDLQKAFNHEIPMTKLSFH